MKTMADIRKMIEFNTPQEDEFKSFIQTNVTENINHARHIETEIHTFTGIYMAVVAGVLAFNFSGRETTFAIIVHVIILCGGLLAMALLGRWYTAFDTHMANADFLSFIENELVFGRMDVKEAVALWAVYTDAYKKAVESRELKPKDKALEALPPDKLEDYKAVPAFFAFGIPKRNAKGPRTRDFVMGFHGVILISIMIILVKDLYGILI